jgi:hypothetical protein
VAEVDEVLDVAGLVVELDAELDPVVVDDADVVEELFGGDVGAGLLDGEAEPQPASATAATTLRNQGQRFMFCSSQVGIS